MLLQDSAHKNCGTVRLQHSSLGMIFCWQFYLGVCKRNDSLFATPFGLCSNKNTWILHNRVHFYPPLQVRHQKNCCTPSKHTHFDVPNYRICSFSSKNTVVVASTHPHVCQITENCFPPKTSRFSFQVQYTTTSAFTFFPASPCDPGFPVLHVFFEFMVPTLNNLHKTLSKPTVLQKALEGSASIVRRGVQRKVVVNCTGPGKLKTSPNTNKRN